ncbi:MAG: co-chaperone DjlA [Saprospiraceae bacterium]
MAWEGKAVLGGIGWAVGGPIGGIIGSFIGHAIDSDEDHAAAAQEQQAYIQTVFLYTLFGMAAKLAKADGTVNQEEIDYLTMFMRDALELDADGQRAAIKIFKEAKRSDTPIEEYAQLYFDTFSDDPDSLVGVLAMLFQLAAADGILHRKEEKALWAVAKIFGLDKARFKQAKRHFFGDTDELFAILECTPDDTDETIKRQYKKLVLDYHPDKLAAQNLSPAILQLAKEKLQQINEAYQNIKKQRGFN